MHLQGCSCCRAAAYWPCTAMARSWSRSACHRSYLGSLQATGSCVRAGVSFRRAAWLPFSDALAARPQLTRNFMSRAPESGEGVDPEWLQVERVLARRVARGGEHAYLVKARQRTGGRRSGRVVLPVAWSHRRPAPLQGCAALQRRSCPAITLTSIVS